MRFTLLLSVLLPFATTIFAAQAVVQTYPAKSVRVVNPYAAGGGLDAIFRPVMARMTENVGQTFVIDNRAGANGQIGSEIVAKAAPDGYTLLTGTTGALSINAAVFPKLPYDPVRDFTPISNVVETAFLLLTHPSLQANNARELAALAKARPGQLSYASFGPASSAHLAGELFSIAAGLKMIHVPYKGSAAATTDLMAGHTQLMFDSLQSSLTHVRSKRLRAIAYAGAKRSRVAPSVPTMAESGFPDVIAGSWYGVLAPANTPSAIITRLHAEIVKAANAPDVRERLENVGVDVIATTPQEFAAAIKSDLDRWSKVVKQANIRLD
jgi:tripartite-type tricarboxylate transporter receptor subunit TctC